MNIIWSEEYELGISVIDGQHQRIVEYINQLNALDAEVDRDQVSQVLHSLVDYTLSHLAFEEAMLEDIDYGSLAEHQIGHRTFEKQVATLQQRFVAGENVGHELAQFLCRWLLEHILTEDAAYCDLVKERLLSISSDAHESWIKRATARFFS